ncbi:MAG: CYTH domain-containing protein [Eubacteriales bacterium]|nr:CYTH domain-containing protein [Eubacteriales bacterium]
MELEFKWSTPDSGTYIEMLTSYQLPPVEKQEHIRMEARYYDTPDGMVNRLHGGLRLRTEGDQTVCCLKLAATSSFGGALKSREEYECAAPDIETGLRRLPQQTDAPADICEALCSAGLVELGRTTFTRQVTTLNTGECTVELSFDCGLITRGERHAPICEIELEYKSGSVEAFEALGNKAQETFHLKPEPQSKLARLLHL